MPAVKKITPTETSATSPLLTRILQRVREAKKRRASPSRSRSRSASRERLQTALKNLSPQAKALIAKYASPKKVGRKSPAKKRASPMKAKSPKKGRKSPKKGRKSPKKARKSPKKASVAQIRAAAHARAVKKAKAAGRR